MRRNPADIIVAIAFSDLFQSILLITNSIFFLTDENPLTNSSSFCQITGFLFVLITYNEILYNISFAIFLILKVKYLLKPITIPNSLFHIMIILIDGLLCVEIAYFSKIGKTLQGVCGLEACSFETTFQQLTKFLVFMIISLFSLWYFRKKIPKQDLEILQLKSNFLNYYQFYVKMALFGYSLAFGIGFMLLLNSYYWKSEIIARFSTLDNLIRLFMMMSLSFTRLQDPFIKGKLKKVFQFFRKNVEEEKENNVEKSRNSENSSPNINYLRKTIIFKDDNEIVIRDHPSNFEINEKIEKFEKNERNSNKLIPLNPSTIVHIELICNSDFQAFSIKPLKKISVFEIESNNNLKELSKGETLDGNKWLDLLGKNLRMSFIHSILTGILVSYHRFQKKKKRDYDTLRSNSLFYQEKMKLKIKEIYLMGEKEEGEKDLIMTIFAGHMFNEIFEKDQDFIDIEASLNIAKNYENIANMKKSEGGKSGEFFFASHDNKLLIKTINTSDLNMFKDHFRDYYIYLTKQNRNSMITPIYGIFSFERADISQIEHVILMRNIVDCPMENIVRIYDLKGSSYDREVLKKKNDGKVGVLKDVDFLKNEGKIFIEFKKEIVVEALKRDALFLRDCGFIDYSLLVIKMKKEERIEDFQEGNGKKIEENENIEEIHKKEILKKIKLKKDEIGKENDLHILKGRGGWYYHVGIIDYFQKYNMKKFLEKYGKKVWKMDLELDTSSQDPEVYAKRFIAFMEGIFEN